MSAHISLILFAGDLTGRLPELFSCFNYKMIGSAETINGGEDVWKRTDYPQAGKPHTIVYKAVFSNGLWTGILDREMVMTTDRENCERCAGQFDVQIFGCIAEGASGTYAFYKYAPKKIRALFVLEGEIIEDFGSPLEEESGIAKDSLFEDDIFEITERMGFPTGAFGDPDLKILIVELDESQIEESLQE